MEVISSRNNATFKEAKRLKEKRYRDRDRKFLIEGEKTLIEAYDNPEVFIDTVLIATRVKKDYFLDGVKKYLIYDDLFDEISETETSQGIIAIIKKKETSKNSFLNTIDKDNSNILVIDRIQDPGNLGTIIRTAAGLGISGIIIIKGTVDCYSPKVVRSASGAMYRIPILQVDSVNDVIEICRETGHALIATAAEANDGIERIRKHLRNAICLGNEGAGLSKELLKKSNEVIRIRMKNGLESLNVAVVGGILMYETMKEDKECKKL
ncbi:MAG: TrmH family RNA methyltransferase [Anaerovoracaceae bacterium]